ncbi:HVM05 protein, partial [Atractosteus spatula]|nr:HVM05 protein [Atractosteus spatula]
SLCINLSPLSLYTGLSTSITVLQAPLALLRRPGASIELSCSHDDSSYDTMYWYQQENTGKPVTLIGYLYYKQITIESGFAEKFNITGDAKKKGLFQSSAVTTEDSAVYFCAVSKHSASDHVFLLQKPF